MGRQSDGGENGGVQTLLVLEDEPPLMRHMLKEYSLIEATTAEEALGLFTSQGRQVDFADCGRDITQMLRDSSGLTAWLRNS